MAELLEEEVIAGVEKLLASMGVTEQPSEGRDERVRQVIEKLTSGEWLACSVKELAQAAQGAGFSGAAHLAYSCKKFTGVSISDVTN